jgi:hypothetical protein
MTLTRQKYSLTLCLEVSGCCLGTNPPERFTIVKNLNVFSSVLQKTHEPVNWTGRNPANGNATFTQIFTSKISSEGQAPQQQASSIFFKTSFYKFRQRHCVIAYLPVITTNFLHSCSRTKQKIWSQSFYNITIQGACTCFSLSLFYCINYMYNVLHTFCIGLNCIFVMPFRLVF